jgi:hypothetical protein
MPLSSCDNTIHGLRNRHGHTIRGFLPRLMIVLVACTSSLQSQDEARIAVAAHGPGEFSLTMNAVIHEKFGVAYPLTFLFDIPAATTGVTVERRYTRTSAWAPLPEKTWADHFNGIEAFRRNASGERLVISAAFPETGDSLFLRIAGGGAASVAAQYRGMPKYYDDRRAAVTVTADDWADWFASMYPPLLSLFRSYGLYVTAGAITGGMQVSTYLSIQHELDSGYVEIAAHSRTHPFTPYANPVSEVVGCVDDLLGNLLLPPLFRRGDTGHVYVWIAPNGSYDTTVDSLISTRNLLVTRMYDMGDTTFSAWEPARQHFETVNPTIEIGAPSWGGGETRIEVLNATFDSVTTGGGIYHMMWHPQTLAPDIGTAYLSGHLQHISGQNDLWYVNFGHLYLYHLFQMVNPEVVTSTPLAAATPDRFELLQNYPNPFNPSTVVRFQVPAAGNVDLRVYDVLAREVAVLVNERREPGSYTVQWDASGMASGVYFCRLTAGASASTIKMILMR